MSEEWTRKNQHLEGRGTCICYELPRGRSSREISRNYHQALQKAGFRELFVRRSGRCGAEPSDAAAGSDPVLRRLSASPRS